MKQVVYIETSVISYLASRPSRDIVVAAHQQVTRDWWEQRREDFVLIASELVAREAGAGDADAAEQRIAALIDVNLVSGTEEALSLAEALVAHGAVPSSAPEDALHIAIAAAAGAEYLLTWNCKHIANATCRAKIEEVCRKRGYEPPILCTPLELLEVC